MGGDWLDVLNPICTQACLAAPSGYPAEVALFYLVRWCQKRADDPDPNLDSLDPTDVREAAARIVRNLAEDGPLVERLVEGKDAKAWTDLRRTLLASAAPRAGPRAGEFADEAVQKVAEILLTGTPPSRAAERLRLGPDGPRGEYVFQSPFTYWARRVAINLVVDELRREARRREPAVEPGPKSSAHVDAATLEKARDALPALLEAIRDLPPVQRSVMVMSLSRRDLHDLVRRRLHELAPDLFAEPDAESPSSDREMAEVMGTTPRRLAASRSAARRKLTRKDPRWGLLLDVLLPHRSTRPISVLAEETSSSGARDA